MVHTLPVRKSLRSAAARGLVAAGAAALVLAIAAPATASSGHPSAARTPRLTEVDQISNQPGKANITDPDLVNSWGLALSPTGPLWVANNGTNTATVYAGGVGGAPVTKAPLTVTIPGGAPTGEAFNDTKGFVIHSSHRWAPATFLFVSEGGDLTAWSAAISGTKATVVAHVNGAVFKGLALVHTKFGPFLLATDFVGGVIDVFDKDFHLVKLPKGVLHDPKLPKGYAPFNVLAVDDHIFVTYAKQVPGQTDEAHGAGLGIVDEYSNLGRRVERIAAFGTLNAPWGLAIAPKGFGKFTGSLLVGNFGDGRINVFRDDHFLGQLRDTRNQPITIDGLWALLPGTTATGGPGTLWFSAGPDDEANGLVGQLIPTS
jgi:uncharacterized protein (TIGR03118 family)